MKIDYASHIERLRKAIQNCNRHQVAMKTTLIRELNRMEKLAEEQGDKVDRTFRIV